MKTYQDRKSSTDGGTRAGALASCDWGLTRDVQEVKFGYDCYTHPASRQGLQGEKEIQQGKVTGSNGNDESHKEEIILRPE